MLEPVADMETEDDGCSLLFPDSDDEQQIALCRLPQQSSDYSTPEYWASRYAKEEDIVYDWYGLEYKTFWETYLKPLVFKDTSILLELGSGNSEWSSRLASSGLWVISTDIDIGVLQAISKNDGGAIIERVAVDARRLPFRQSIFDFVVDKGTLDALFCAQSFPTEKIVSERPKRMVVNRGRETATFSKDENFVKKSEKKTCSEKFVEKRENNITDGNKVVTLSESCECHCSSAQFARQKYMFLSSLPQITPRTSLSPSSSLLPPSITAGHCIVENLFWKRDLLSGLICVSAVVSQKNPKNPKEPKSRELNNIMSVAKATYNAMRKGGSWMVITAKEPFQILEAMKMNIWYDGKKGYTVEGYGDEGCREEGYGEEGYREEGCREEGYNEKGCREEGHRENGCRENGCRENGCRKEGYREEGYRKETLNWFHVQTHEKECGVHVMKLTKL